MNYWNDINWDAKEEHVAPTWNLVETEEDLEVFLSGIQGTEEVYANELDHFDRWWDMVNECTIASCELWHCVGDGFDIFIGLRYSIVGEPKVFLCVASGDVEGEVLAGFVFHHVTTKMEENDYDEFLLKALPTTHLVAGSTTDRMLRKLKTCYNDYWTRIKNGPSKFNGNQGKNWGRWKKLEYLD